MFQFKLTTLLILVVLLSGFNSQTDRPRVVKWVINKGGSLKVGGSTNVNNFTCVITSYNRPDTLVFYKENNSQPIKMNGFMTLDVQHFDCNNPVMTADLRKTLKAKDFPKLIIRFTNLSRYPDYHEKSDVVKGTVTIELAGVTKYFTIDYKFTSNGENSLFLTGRRRIYFSDFQIVPPRKIGGMIQTKDELNIEFNLRVNTLN